jgi:hypothetical protein
MEKEFVTYEQALALKELGLNIDNYVGVYGLDGRHLYNVHGNKFDAVDELFFIKAPLKQQVFRWFREKYELIAGIRYNKFPDMNGKQYYYECDYKNSYERYNTYEEAENACIDKLIEIAKQQN